YTMKTQLLVSPKSKMTYEIASSKGKTHDFKMFKDTKPHIPAEVKIVGDSGYQGIKDICFNSRPPNQKKKKSKQRGKSFIGIYFPRSVL
ncbi:MAG: transposase, partial [PVC group bacterium]|nr:transposase [PVC group bacterium]